MTRVEFASVMAILQEGTGCEEISRERAEVYWDLLCDLPLPIIRAAVKQSLLRHQYPSLPPVGLIRKCAVELQSPTTPALIAWGLFRDAVARFGSGKTRRKVDGQWRDVDRSEIGLASLPADVAAAARAFGWQRLCDTAPEHLGLAERDFISAYGVVQEREQQIAIMPPDVKALAAGIGVIQETESLVQLALTSGHISGR